MKTLFIFSLLIVSTLLNDSTDSIKHSEELSNFMQSLQLPVPKAQATPTQNSCIVKLRFPLKNGVFKQGIIAGKEKNSWQFSWFPCPGATKYQLYVINISALNPIINANDIRTTKYLYESIGGPLTWVEGWTWKVRAYVGGQWGKWSETRTFGARQPQSFCTIAGYIHGDLQGESYSDVGGEHYTVVLKTVFLRTPEGNLVRQATLQGRSYRLDNIPANRSYRIYPDERFISDPEYIEIINIIPGRRYLQQNFHIKGVNPSE